MSNSFLVIAGTEKAGTTSLFQYLSDSNDFYASYKKETDYLRGGRNISYASYVEQFKHHGCRDKVFLEASPGYLCESEKVAKNIASLGLKNQVFVFLLRSPIQRLKSSFLFHKSRLYIPKDMSFDQYVNLCFRYEEGECPENLGLREWFLKVPDAGLYAKHLNHFLEVGASNLLVFEYDDFSKNPRLCIDHIYRKLDLRTTFPADYEFKRSNVTTSFKFAPLQSLALKLNSSLEGFFYKYPGVKKGLLRIYNAVNSEPKEKVTLTKDNAERLKQFYADDIAKLVKMGYLNDKQRNSWISDFSKVCV